MDESCETNRSATILCVDDEKHVLTALDRALHRTGFRLLLVDRGSHALELLESEKIDVIVCDEAMPGLCGTEVLRLAKHVSPHTVRILLSAYFDDVEVVVSAVNECEVFRIIPKPWEASSLRTTILEAVAACREGVVG